MIYPKQRGDGFIAALIAIVFLSFVAAGVWESAKNTVVSSCEKQGSFYVGDRIFSCQERKQ